MKDKVRQRTGSEPALNRRPFFGAYWFARRFPNPWVHIPLQAIVFVAALVLLVLVWIVSWNIVYPAFHWLLQQLGLARPTIFNGLQDVRPR